MPSRLQGSRNSPSVTHKLAWIVRLRERFPSGFHGLVFLRWANELKEASFNCSDLSEVSLRLPKGGTVSTSREIRIAKLNAVVLPETDRADVVSIGWRVWKRRESEIAAAWTGELPILHRQVDLKTAERGTNAAPHVSMRCMRLCQTAIQTQPKRRR